MPPESMAIEDSLLLLIDLVEGPLKAVQSVARDQLRKANECLVEGATLLGIPILQLRAPLPDNASAGIVEGGTIVRHSFNDAWRSPGVVSGVEVTGRKHLIFAGIATEVGIALTAMSAKRADYLCTVLLDSCGTVSAQAEQCAVRRLTLAGIPLQSWSGCLAELQANYTIGKGPELLKIIARGTGSQSLVAEVTAWVRIGP